MKTAKTKKIFIFATVVGLLASQVPNIIDKVHGTKASATSYCTTQACINAEQAEKDAIDKANNAAAAADTLEGEVSLLNEEIAMYEARIAANEARKSDLEQQISENTKKLELQQQALANMLVDMHFEGNTEAIMILASSSSLSDFAEKQSRMDTAKDQISLSAQTIKSLKENLESQKTEVERIIKDQEIQKTAIKTKRDYQQKLVDQYRDNQAQYTADAAAARQQKLDEIEKAREAYLAQYGVGTLVDGTDNYPFKGDCPKFADYSYFTAGWGAGLKCECVSYVSYMVAATYGLKHWKNSSSWGDAKMWDERARADGLRVDSTPSVGSVAQTNYGIYGHVMWVEQVLDNNRVLISEYNGAKRYQYSSRIINASGYNFIHFD